MTEPFILKSRTLIPNDATPRSDQIYDPILQLWVNTTTGRPVVNELCSDLNASQFGETTQTRAPEGADQPITNNLAASQFGETTMTRTSGEGSDQSTEVLNASQFGETSITEAKEGVDSIESIAMVTHATDSFF